MIWYLPVILSEVKDNLVYFIPPTMKKENSACWLLQVLKPIYSVPENTVFTPIPSDTKNCQLWVESGAGKDTAAGPGCSRSTPAAWSSQVSRLYGICGCHTGKAYHVDFMVSLNGHLVFWIKAMPSAIERENYIFQKTVLACCWALVEMKQLIMGYQITVSRNGHHELGPIMSWTIISVGRGKTNSYPS